MNIRLLGNTYLVLALVLGALVPVMLDIASTLNISQFLFYAYAIGAVTSFAVLLATGRKERIVQYVRSPKSFAAVALIGLLNYAFLEFGLSYAEKFISASLATVVYRAYPLLMLLFLPTLLRERVTKYQVVALSLGVLGIYLAFTGGSAGFSGIAHAPIILLVVIIAIANALATVLVKKYSFDMITGMFIFNLANMLLFGAAALISGAAFSAFATKDIVALLYIGVVYNVFVGFMYYSAFRMLKSTIVANVYFLSPFITILFANLILGEAILPYYLIIAGLVAAGMVIQKFDTFGGTYLRKSRRNTAASNKYVLFDVTSAFVNTKDEAIYNAISNGGRVLAINASNTPKNAIERVLSSIKQNDVLVYADYHNRVNEDERSFVREIVGAGDSDSVVMCAGPHELAENAIDALVSHPEFTWQWQSANESA
ncbi:MAG: EamA family transporter [Candidatus Micrarchaeia archaeon]